MLHGYISQDDDRSDIEKDDDLELDDEDLDLLNDNLDIQQRPAGGRVVIESDEEEDHDRSKSNLYDKVCCFMCLFGLFILLDGDIIKQIDSRQIQRNCKSAKAISK